MEYNFSGKITLDDYIKFNENALNLNKNMYKPSILFRGLISLFLFGICIYLFFFKLFVQPKIGLYVFILFFAVALLFALSIIYLQIIYPKILRRTCKKYYYSNKLIAEMYNYVVTENSIKIINDYENTILTKEKILKIECEEDSIFIFIGLGQAYIIKKHFFENDKEFEELKIFINENYLAQTSPT